MFKFHRFYAGMNVASSICICAVIITIQWRIKRCQLGG